MRYRLRARSSQELLFGMLLLAWLTLAISAGDEAGLQELTFMARGFVEPVKPLRAIFMLSGAILFLLLWLIAEP
jgi:hypothetical protein